MDLIVGYDGSRSANGAIRAGGRLFPEAHAVVVYLCTPPFASRELRRRLRSVARNVDELIEMTEREGEAEARLLVDTGVILARAAGWDAEPLVKRTWAGESLGLAQTTEELSPDLVIVGARGLGGADGKLGSVSDLVVHHAARPVLVVPQPLLIAEYEALATGPVAVGGPIAVGHDGSSGATAALMTVRQLLPQREVLLITVDDGDRSAGPEELSDEKVTVVRVKRGRGFGAGGTADALIGCADERNAAMLVVGSRGHSAARKVLLGSVATATLHATHRPVMVVPHT